MAGSSEKPPSSTDVGTSAPEPAPGQAATAGDSSAPAPPVNPGTQAVVEAVEALPGRIVDALRAADADTAAAKGEDTPAEGQEPAEYEVLVGRLVRRDSEPGKPFNYTRFRKGDSVTFPAAHQAEDRDRFLRIGAIKPAGGQPQARLTPDPPTMQASGLGADPVREAAIVAGVSQTVGASSEASADDQPKAPGEA